MPLSVKSLMVLREKPMPAPTKGREARPVAEIDIGIEEPGPLGLAAGIVLAPLKVSTPSVNWNVSIPWNVARAAILAGHVDPEPLVEAIADAEAAEGGAVEILLGMVQIVDGRHTATLWRPSTSWLEKPISPRRYQPPKATGSGGDRHGLHRHVGRQGDGGGEHHGSRQRTDLELCHGGFLCFVTPARVRLVGRL